MSKKSPKTVTWSWLTDLEALCEDLDVTQEEITEKLSGIDYHYDREKNQFI